MSRANDDTTYVVRLTAAGRGAIASIAVTGPRAAEIVGAEFRPASGKPLAEFPWGRVLFGRAGTEPGEEIVVCRTAANTVELHCHGGEAAVAMLIERLCARGATVRDWRDQVRAAAADPLSAEAWVLLPQAPTRRTAGILLEQAHGALARAMAELEAAIVAGDMASAASLVEGLLARRTVGLHLVQPFRVVLAGRTNVGKSSLGNAILGYARSLVSEVPGTTRDVVTAQTAIDGWPVEIVDTAGRRTSDEPIERQGIARAKHQAVAADLVLLVFDASQAVTDEDRAIFAQHRDALVVLNKCDLLGSGTPLPSRQGQGEGQWYHHLDPSPGLAPEGRGVPQRGRSGERHQNTVLVSALTGEGIEALVAAIGSRLVSSPPKAGAAMPFAVEQFERLVAIRAALVVGDVRGACTMLAAWLLSPEHGAPAS